MTEQDALSFANEKLREYGLAGNWTVEIQPGRLGGNGLCMGATRFYRRGGGIIILRLRDVLGHGAKEVHETILHEIAHALAGPGAGHGPKWREMARRVGARDNAHGAPDYELELTRMLLKAGVRR